MFQSSLTPRTPITLAIILAAFALRIIWASLIPVVPVSDGLAYFTFAENIANGHGYCWEPGKPTAYWAVGAPAVYGLILWLTNHSLLAIAFYNVVVGTASVWLTMAFVSSIASRRVSAIAGITMAFWPSQIQFVTTFNSELTFIFLVLALMVVFARYRTHLGFSVLEGLFTGLACLVRPIALLMPFVLLISSIGQGKNITDSVKRLVISLGICLAVVLPWSMRNKSELGEFVLVSTNRGPNLWMGNHAGTDGTYTRLPARYERLPEVERDRVLNAIAVQYIKEKPVEFVIRTMKKFVMLHRGETIGVHWNSEGIQTRLGDWLLMPLKAISSIYWFSCVLLAVLGFIMIVRTYSVRYALFHPAFIMWAYVASVHAVIVVQDRYHFPVVPFVATLAAVAVDKMFESSQSRGAK